ncbi:gamma-glutamyl-gamma-aminobutyrate hydrolase family protein [Rufibacter ruber]|uniref:gamma-glutamyl-gamma-aminobutyrate hydrolase family protein n=1 Tax=Rufibacter ruber TaxID=1783499 RepID=UPI000834EED7|nr:gamma-glutamyl-gamma-aminobutyrate hydrolase family protein [Rufibacter ruber]
MAFLENRNKINRNRPTIGVTGPDKGGEVAWLFAALGVRLAGGKPVRITPSSPRTSDGLQGLIIGGGADIDPQVFQQENLINEYLQRTLQHPRKSFLTRVGRFIRWTYYPLLFFLRKLFSRKPQWSVDRERDHLEFQLIHQAFTKRLPVLGICRGSQLMNVYFGGTLYQDIQTFYKEEPNPSSIFPVKKVRIAPGSKLQQVLGVEKLKVNALHHQAVHVPGRGIQIVAREKNQVVQAIENTLAPFMLGVQWHPEYLPQHQEQRRIFKSLVQHARLVQAQIEEPDMQQAISSPRSRALEAIEQQEMNLQPRSGNV